MSVIYTPSFMKWIRALHDTQARALIYKKIHRVGTEESSVDFYPVGEDVYELRIQYGNGYRVYFSYFDDQIIILNGSLKIEREQAVIQAKEILKNL